MRSRLDQLLAGWWLPDKPEGLVLGWDCEPLGVILCPVDENLHVLRLPSVSSVSAALLAAPQDQLDLSISRPVMPHVQLDRVLRQARTWRLAAEVDGGRLEHCGSYLPWCRPLPHPAVLLLVLRLEEERRSRETFAQLKRRVIRALRGT